MADEYAAAGDEIERRMQLEEKQVAWLERLEVRLAPWPPKIDLIGSLLGEKSEPFVVGYSYEKFHFLGNWSRILVFRHASRHKISNLALIGQPQTHF